MYSIISNSCVGYKIHKKLYTNEKYITPLIASCINDDLQYIDFIERFNTLKHYPLIYCRHTPRNKPKPFYNMDLNYPIYTWGCLDIHWIHELGNDISRKKLEEKFERRRLRCLQYEPYFILSTTEMFQGFNIDLVQRFLNTSFKKLLIVENYHKDQIKKIQNNDENTTIIYNNDNKSLSQIDIINIVYEHFSTYQKH